MQKELFMNNRNIKDQNQSEISEIKVASSRIQSPIIENKKIQNMINHNKSNSKIGLLDKTSNTINSKNDNKKIELINLKSINFNIKSPFDISNVFNKSPINEKMENLNIFELNNFENKKFLLNEKTRGKSRRKSKRDFSDNENILVLREKYNSERENSEKKKYQDIFKKNKLEKHKKLGRQLISYSENKIKHFLLILDFIILFFIISDIAIEVFSNYMFTSDLYDRNKKMIKERFDLILEIRQMRIVIIVIIAIIEILMMIKYYYKLKLYRIKGIASYRDGLFSSGLYKKLFIEMLVLSVFTPPDDKSLLIGNTLNGTFIYSTDSLILLIKLFKLYYLITIFMNLSIWVSPKTREIAKKLRYPIGFFFAIKANLTIRPFSFIFLIFFSLCIIFSFIIRISEYGFIKDSSYRQYFKSPFDNYFDVFWVTILKFMRVGYKENAPQTHIGRLISILCVFLGIFFVSVIITRVMKFIELGYEEKKAFNLIVHHNKMIYILGQAKILIKGIFHLRLIKIKKKDQFLKGNK